ncbi:DUF58 domain-containing protein [Peribacillus glennii]|uniref:DUF58 domain-containing protein n=1 Tax=Peribacillus glennii TaxID=2303991 RepID=A0A372LBD6_9BACI|nr:DUF58 domain-containing protein [Peribacillus glennii]RFU63098.1 DUF58 domain-containing protein [Peribacillus glennii]
MKKLKNKLPTKLKTCLKMAGLLFLVALSFVFAMFQGGFVSWFLFYSFLPFAIYSSILFFYPIHKFQIGRNLSKREARAGDRVEVTIKVSRKTRFPLFFLLVEQKLPQKLERSMAGTKKIMVFPWFKRSFSLTYTLENLPRGEHSFEGIRLKTGDFLGLFDKEAAFDIPERLLVYPSYSELTYKQLDHLFDQGQAGTANRLQREHSIVSGVRGYQPGDQLSWINWKVTAKKNDIMTKEFEEMKSHDVFLVLDESPAGHFEAIVSYAASFVHSINKKGIQFGFYRTGMNGEVLAIRGGELQKQNIFYSLAKAEPNAEYPIDSFLGRNVLVTVASNASLVIFTSDLSMKTIESAARSKTGQATTILFLKNNPLSREEQAALELAKAKGINVKYVNEGTLEGGKSEVIAQ